MKYSGQIHIVYDGMWGSCGKGKFCGLLARDSALNIKVCVNNNAPNAGHTFVFDNGEKVVTKHIPIGFVNQNIPYLVIGESAVIDYDRLVHEIDQYKDILNGRKIYICDTAAVILPEHKASEISQIKSGSTYSGAGAALVDKIMRKSPLVKNDERFIRLEKEGLIKIVSSKTFFPMIYNGMGGFKGDENILVELSQGDALGLNNTANYPHTTSRDCTPAQALKDIHATGLNSWQIMKYCVFRPYPIRINNVGEGGYVYTGDFEGAKEISWQEVAARAGLNAEELGKNEHTTVTKRLRRVAELSVKQFAEMLLDTRPDKCFLNFAQYINGNMQGLENRSVKETQKKFCEVGDFDDEYYQIAEKNWAIEETLGYIEEMEEYFNDLLGGKFLDITLLGTGAKEKEVVDRECIQLVSMDRHAYKDINPFDYADKTNTFKREL